MKGNVERFSEKKQTVTLKNGNYEALLSLNRHTNKVTWLLTGWDVRTDPKEEKREYLKKKGLASDERGKICTIHSPTQTRPILCRPCLGANQDLKDIINELKKKSTMNKHTIIFDNKSKRSFDINGFMHMECSNLTKESVDPYYGYEIVNSKALGFEPDKIYFGYRKGRRTCQSRKNL